MATITTDTYLDDGTARTAGEQMSINGAILTVRTDTRWHASAPAGMTGTISLFTVSNDLGGEIYFDGTKVRWVAFYAAGGTVPTIGSTCSIGPGVGNVYDAGNSPKANPSLLIQGYVLGVYASLTSAPSAVGSVMPSSGFIKFREVTNGPFPGVTLAAGDYYTPVFSNGITTLQMFKEDVTGWIEVVTNSANVFSLNGISRGLKVRGDWFYLTNTSGVRGQTIQIPTNGGGANTHVQAVQIETSPGSNVYDWWIGQTVANGFTAANLTTADNRAKIFLTNGNGLITIGSDGTTNIAGIPPANCKVRIPNVMLRSSGNTAAATNAIPSTSIGIAAFSGGGTIDIEYLLADSALLPNASVGITKATVKHSVFPLIAFTNHQSLCTFDNIAVGGYLPNTGINTFNCTNSSAGLIINNITAINYCTGSNAAPIRLASIDNVMGANINAILYRNRISFSGYILDINICSNVVLSNINLVGYPIQIYQSQNISITNIDYIDNYAGITNSAIGVSMFAISGNINVSIDGISFGQNGLFTGVNPYGAVITGTGNLGYLKIRNAGTKIAPLNCGTALLYPQQISTVSAQYLYLQRLYFTGTRSTTFSIPKFAKIEHVYVNSGGSAWQLFGNSSLVRNVNTPYNLTSLNLTPGQNWADYFTSDTAGTIVIAFNATSDSSAPYITKSWAPKQGTGFKGDGSLSMDTVGDYTIFECPYPILGHSGFQNVALSRTGFGLITDYEFAYQLDTGSGYSGIWKIATAANLSAETISPAGFKMKVKITWVNAANTAGTGYINNIRIPTISTAQAQADNLYPLNTNTLAFTGLATGSEVRCYQGTDPATAVEIGGIESTSGSTFSFTHSSGGQAGYITILAMGFQPVRFDYTFKSTDDSILIQPVIDRNYVNPA